MAKKLTAKAELFLFVLDIILTIIAICALIITNNSYRELINEIKSSPSPIIKCQPVAVSCSCPNYNYMPYWGGNWNLSGINLSIYNYSGINYYDYLNGDYGRYSTQIFYYNNKSD